MFGAASRQSFKNKYSLEKRQAESARMKEKYPRRVAVIIERATNKSIITLLPDIDKTKFLVPKDLTIGQFLYVIRKRLVLQPEMALYVFCDKTLPATTALMSQIAKDHIDEDGFLYMVYSAESTFG
jgi:GABA(A) receptor-associated protein